LERNPSVARVCQHQLSFLFIESVMLDAILVMIKMLTCRW